MCAFMCCIVCMWIVCVCVYMYVSVYVPVQGYVCLLLSAISTVAAMGYNETQARAALTATDNNLER